MGPLFVKLTCGAFKHGKNQATGLVGYFLYIFLHFVFLHFNDALIFLCKGIWMLYISNYKKACSTALFYSHGEKKK